MKIQFTERLRLSRNNKDKLDIVNSIIEEYSAQGYQLTLRQLYYQLVSRDIIPNTSREYSKLSTLLVQGRMAGIVDWDAIEDRVRVPYIPYYAANVSAAINDVMTQYRIDRMASQDTYIEVWVEKDALSGILRRITSHYHIHLMVNRGYSSCTAMYDAAVRIGSHYEQDCHILYLGDHDPSGIDMVRDIENRLSEFGVAPTITRVALLSSQIREYSPPPNPAKISDPRAKNYIDMYGDTSWEVDALSPDILHGLLRTAIESLIDMDRFNDSLKQEAEDKTTMETIIARL